MSGRIGKAHVIFEPLCEWTSGEEKKCTSDEELDFGIPLEKFCTSGASKIQYSYPVKIMIPQYCSSSMCQWVYFMSYGGGLVEGDQLQLQLDVGEQCCTLLTTQASTKVYCCEEGEMTRQDIICTVGPNALLAIVPHTVIPFKDAMFTQTQKVSLSVDSNLVLLDWLTAGRVARGELWQFSSVTTSNCIEVDGEIVFKEAVCLKDSPHQSVVKAMGKYQVTGTLLMLGNLLQPLVKRLLAVLGKHKNYDDVYDCTSITSISELKYSVKAGMMQGCLIRFVGRNTTEVQKLLHFILKPLYPVFGGDPFNK